MTEIPVERWIQGIGPIGKYMIVLDFPSGLNWKKHVHLWGQEQQIFNGTLKGCGIDPKDCYVTYAVPYGLDGKKPTADDLLLAAKNLRREILQVQPKKILLVGNVAYAAAHGLPKTTNVVDLRGRGEFLNYDGQKFYTVTTIPPYFVTSNPDQFRDLSYDIDKWSKMFAPRELPILDKVVVRSTPEVKALFDILGQASAVSCDLETQGLDPEHDKIDSIGFGGLTDENEGLTVVIPRELIYESEVIDLVADFVSGKSSTCQVVFHNAKFDLAFLSVYTGRSFLDGNIKDTILMNYLLDERPVSSAAKPHGLKGISRVRYDAEDYKFSFTEFWKKPVEERDYESLYEYHALDLFYTVRLYFDLLREMYDESPKLVDLLNNIIMPALKSFVEIELHGILIDRAYLKEQEKLIEKDLEGMIEEIRQKTRESSPGLFLMHNGEVSKSEEFLMEFNPNSYLQVAQLVYDILRMPDFNKRATDKESLQTLVYRYPDSIGAEVLKKVLKYREQSKALSTYVRGLLEAADDRDRVHSDFNLNGTATGRLSSSEPNLQNIPTLMGPVIRKAFIAPPGFTMAECDYSQLELRVAALYSGDKIMTDAYVHNRDIHKEVAAAAFGVPYDEVTYDQRYAAKYIDFGVIYGRSADSLATGQELVEYNWTIDQAQRFIDQFLGQFKGLQEWMKNQQKQVGNDQYVETLTGRRRRWPLILDRGHANRQAVNTPIQGLASDFTVTALIRLHKRLKVGGYRTKIVSTVHDSILFEIYNPELDVVCAMIREEMIKPPVPCNVPIKVDVEIGPNWGELEEWVPPKKEWYFHAESGSLVEMFPSEYLISNESGLLEGPLEENELVEIRKKLERA